MKNKAKVFGNCVDNYNMNKVTKNMKKFTFGQLVKSRFSGDNYRIAKVDDNIYIVESSDRELSYGCHDDFIAIGNDNSFTDAKNAMVINQLNRKINRKFS